MRCGRRSSPRRDVTARYGWAMALETDDLVARAIEAAGSDDLGEPTWREGLDRLVDALAGEARLSELGAQIVEGELQGYLASRLQIVDWAARHREVADAEIRPPIVIVGQARTGTTILFDLLAQDPRMRAPLSWEVERPMPPPSSATYETDPRIDQVDAALAMVDLVVPGFRSFHPLGARLGQECVRITALDFRSVIFGTQYRVPSFARWVLHDADMAPAYRWHRRFLRHLHSGHPGEPWLLKSPGHIWSLDALLGEYPDAVLVQTHRDPLKAIASVSALVALLRRIACDDPSITEAAEEWAEYLLVGFDRSVQARTDGTVRPDRVIDVQFADFMADPMATVRTVYDRLGLELTAEAASRISAFHEAHPGDSVGQRYSFADTGLDAGELRERARSYQQHFDVPSEPVR